MNVRPRERHPPHWQRELLPAGGDLFGLLCRPLTSTSRRTCVVLLNAGFMPRSGPFRLHVRLARHLAARGYPVFRFDLPGIGDSLAYADRPQAEIVQGVFDVLERKTGCHRFVAGGICSAANLAWRLALADPRMAGAVLIDAVARRTFAYRLGQLRRARHKSWAAWRERLGRLLRPDDSTVAADLSEWPEPGSERAQLEALVGRGMELFFLYTGGTSYFLHRGQFIGTFGHATRAQSVHFEHWPRCDHLFYDETDRDDLIEAIGAWLEDRLPD
ncbi:MAG: alpha/beta fold hydrolase [Xanthomonadales bacterium]|nr:alpha/beta fold hydrolase [Xanthomonadales bacterium]